MLGLSRRSRRLVGMAVVALVGGCSGSDAVDPDGQTGSLTVAVSGLPGGVAATVTVTSPSGFTRAVTVTETLAGLEPGTYTVTALAIDASNGRYAPTPATQTVPVVASTTPATASVSYALATGSMTIAVTGLPFGTNGAVTVTGANGFSRAVTLSTTLTTLEPGSYVVTAADVPTAEDRFAPSAASQTVSIVAGSVPVAVVVTYALASGRLSVTVTGLPAGFSTRANDITPTAAANAAVTISGPDGYTRTITATTLIIQLKPGVYTVTASDVVSGGFTYRPTPSAITVTVAASTTATTASISYAVINGSLTVTVTGLPQGVNASVTVSGPSGFTQLLTGTTTLASRAPGSYSIAAASVTSGATNYDPLPTSQVATVIVGAATSVSVAYAVPFALRLTQVATGLERPVSMVSPASDSRLFVVEQTGRIRIIQNGLQVTTPFLDLAAKVLAINDVNDEQGLLGLAFHPQYATNGFFFVFYMDVNQDIVVERYQVSANPNVANAVGTLVLKIPHRVHTSHNGGGLAFGPDGFLYISLGDGGCCGDPLFNGQNLNSLLGKVLRLDVSTVPYTIPPSNPFVGQAGSRGEIWAYGLRNPWRIDIDATTSVLYIADVGEATVEEVDAVPLSVAGPNFGWKIMEGTRCVQAPCSSAGLTLPVAEYLHAEGCSITGGFVYRGSQIPGLLGHYLYSDYCAGFLRSFLLVNGAATQQRDWNIAPPGSVTSFGRDATGELYLLTREGAVFRIVKQ